MDSLKRTLPDTLVQFNLLVGKTCLDEDGIMKENFNDVVVDFIYATSNVVSQQHAQHQELQNKAKFYLFFHFLVYNHFLHIINQF